MEDVKPAETHRKLSRYWSDRREREIVTRVRYTVREEEGCRIYEFTSIEDGAA